MTLGFTVEPLDNLSILVDYWRIEISDRIIAPGLAFILRNEDQLGSDFVTREPPDQHEAKDDAVAGLVPTVISVNECDPLRDEGIEFYRLLLRSGVPARCRQVMGTIHGTEIFALLCPEISRETAHRIADFCRPA